MYLLREGIKRREVILLFLPPNSPPPAGPTELLVSLAPSGGVTVHPALHGRSRRSYFGGLWLCWPHVLVTIEGSLGEMREFSHQTATAAENGPCWGISSLSCFFSFFFFFPQRLLTLLN